MYASDSSKMNTAPKKTKVIGIVQIPFLDFPFLDFLEAKKLIFCRAEALSCIHFWQGLLMTSGSTSRTMKFDWSMVSEEFYMC